MMRSETNENEDNGGNVETPNTKKTVAVRPDPNKLYRASLHRVKCQGAFYVKKHLSLGRSSVLCKGIQSRFETIHEYPPMKPAAALQTFRRSTSPLDDEDLFQHDKSESQNENDIMPHVIDSKWTELKNTMKEHSNLKVEKLDKVIESDATFYGTSNCYFLSLKPYYDSHGRNVHHGTYESNESIRWKAHQASKSYRTINGESILKDIDNNPDSNDEQKDNHIPEKSIIYAIAPKSEFGLAKRLINNKDEGLACSSTTIKLGILEIHMASFQEYQEVLESSQSTPMDKSQMTESRDLRKESQIQSMDFLHRFENMSNKIQSQMYKNLNLIKEELENDFFNRTVKGAQTVVGNFHKTALRMKKTATDIINFFNDK
jgi:hypothetical protein